MINSDFYYLFNQAWQDLKEMLNITYVLLAYK